MNRAGGLPGRIPSYDGIRRYPIDTPVGVLSAAFDGEYLVELSFADLTFPGICGSQRLPDSRDFPGAACPADSNGNAAPSVLRDFRRELDLYFEGRLRSFSVRLRLTGPPFFVRVWRTLMEIPFGQTRTYSQVASLAGSPRACRAVGNACAANPIAIVIPCHRVVACGGLGGYGGGLVRKEWLLSHEARWGPGSP